MPDDNMSLMDAIAPTVAPAPEPAPAPAPAPPVNPYIPPAAPPAIDPAQPPPAQPAAVEPPAPAQPGTTETPPAPAIPPEYLEAHEWRGKISEEAQVFGGLDYLPGALKWSRLLFGLDAPPDGMSPAGYFMEELFNVDRDTYQSILNEVASTHKGSLVPLLEEAVLAHHKIPKDRLAEVQNFLKYGAANPAQTAYQEMVGLLAPDLQGVFPKLSQPFRNWLVDQVDRGLMTMEMAEEQIREKSILLSLQEREEQTKRDEAARVESDSRSYARDRANEEIGRYQETFVDAYARRHSLDKRDVLEKVAYVAGTLDNAAEADERHPARIAWDDLQKACASNNEIRIKAAMSKLQIAFETEFNKYMTSRSGAPVPTPAPPAQPRDRQPQFEPDKSPNSTDWSKMDLTDYLFGRAPA